ncbi:MAG TPA: hypothetical protein DD457_11620 [Gammaproteobacteria bacterium]|nr:hypothetical protein [Gammaproteobacteria bacterium]MEE3183261.1 DUF6644 family protein [Pseudomonadota bacterium]HBP15849.1 hypothetical protein [Gammaproteobacteria bacterium]HCP50174.1 hypothetical protein [Gammaproteobacteria bacterium]|tara:strand:+ start:2298 stop:2765 length:468 start_codon:yes stop_codon:yes gene_type:complete
MSWLDVFESLEQSGIGLVIRESLWLFPAFEAVHLLGLSVLGGSLLMVDLRLLGVGIRSRTPAQLVRTVRPWLVGSLLILIGTGVPLFLSEAVKCYYSFSFWVKMSALGIGLLYTFLIKHPVIRRGTGSGVQALIGMLSLAVWLTVAGAGRWIGFS